VNADQLGVKGPWIVRDLWERKDLGNIGDGISLTMKSHGVKLLRVHEAH